jgi:hypothetical protein
MIHKGWSAGRDGTEVANDELGAPWNEAFFIGLKRRLQKLPTICRCLGHIRYRRFPQPSSYFRTKRSVRGDGTRSSMLPDMMVRRCR